MPIYEFECTECHKTEEIMQKVSDPAPEVCPHCGRSGTMHKMVSQTSFQLKGGGWYNDLYASTKSSGSTTKSESTASVPAAAPAKSDSKD